MKTEAKYDPKTGKATYGQSIRHGEVVRGTKIFGGGPAAYGQDLAGEPGISGAKAILLGCYTKK